MITVDTDNTQPLDAFWAIVSRDDQGNEGILGVGNEQGERFPLICGEEKNVDKIIEIAKKVFTQDTDKRIFLLKFSKKEEIMEIGSTVQ